MTSSSLYGWRQGGDYGLIGSPGGSAPATGPYVPYPTYFAEELASKIIQAGGNVVQASSSDPNLTTYAVLEPNGHLDLLVINKKRNERTDRPVSDCQLSSPRSQATVWQYGEAQDTAQSQTSDGAIRPGQFHGQPHGERLDVQLFVPGVLDDRARPGQGLGRDVRPDDHARRLGRAQPRHTARRPCCRSSATDPSGTSGLTYTWVTTGNAPRPPSASAPTAPTPPRASPRHSRRRDSYAFQVTVTDPSGYIATQQRDGRRSTRASRRSRSAPARSRSVPAGTAAVYGHRL